MNRLLRWSTGITLMNMLCGFVSIRHSLEGEFLAAAWFILFAAVVDALDGKLARLTGTDDFFGIQLDSMADLISFGGAPALLIYQVQLHNAPFWGFVFAFAYLFTGGWRLARFNADHAGDRTRGYFGLPIPISGMTLASFVLFQSILDEFPLLVWMVLTACLAAIMVSSINYHWPKVTFQNKRNAVHSIMNLIGVLVMAVFPRETLFPLLLIYILIPIGRTTCSALALGKS
jgi:CDP-diacylglycerol---serine O-phosphatidyltransferase